MRELFLKQLQAKIASLTQFFIGLNFYEEVIDDLENNRKEVQKVHDELQSQLKDEKLIKSMDHYEQRALAENAQNYKHALMELSQGIESLIARKYTRSIQIALYTLDEMRVDLKDLMSGVYLLEESSKEIRTKNVLNEKKFSQVSYKTKLGMVQSAAGAIRDEILYGEFLIEGKDDFMSKVHQTLLFKSLGRVEQLVQEEIESIEANGMPNPYDFKLPELVVPEVPEGPNEETENVETEEVKES